MAPNRIPEFQVFAAGITPNSFRVVGWHRCKTSLTLIGEKVTAYLVVDTALTNPEMYETYKLKAKPIVEKYGGEYLARGGSLSVKEHKLWSPTRMVLIKFPSAADAETFYQSEEYQKVLPIGLQSADRTVFILEGM